MTCQNVGQQGYEFWLSVSLDVHIGDNTCDMADFIPTEHNHLLPVFLFPGSIHLHTVYKCLISEIHLHSCNIHHAFVREFLKLPAIDVSPAHGNNLFMLVIIRCKHERAIGCGRSELYVARHSLIGMYEGMHLDAAFLPARLRMTSDTLEYSVGEKT